MIQLFYTGVVKHNDLQPDTLRSLGGHISATNFYNGSQDNLFDQLTVSQIKNKQSQYRLLALKATGVTTDLKIWLEASSDLIDFKLAFVEPEPDDCSNPIFESIPFNTVQPSQATFGVYTQSSPPLTSFTSESYLGIWIKQEIKDNAYTIVRNKYKCDDFKDNLENEKQIINFTIRVEHN
jgi:hypothetical protein